MSLQHELSLPNPFSHKAQEAMFNIVVTGTLLVKEGEKILRPFGLTDAQFNILMLLKYQSDDGRINQTRLGEMLLVNRSNITGLVDRMEKASLVIRTSDLSDRRIKYIEMTDKGREILKKTHTMYHKRLDDVMSSLSDSESGSLCSILKTVRRRLNNRDEKPPRKHFL